VPTFQTLWWPPFSALCIFTNRTEANPDQQLQGASSRQEESPWAFQENEALFNTLVHLASLQQRYIALCLCRHK